MKTWNYTLKSFTRFFSRKMLDTRCRPAATRFSDSRDPNRVLKTPQKNLHLPNWSSLHHPTIMYCVCGIMYEFLGSNYCIPKWWPTGTLQLSLPPAAQNSSYATVYTSLSENLAVVWAFSKEHVDIRLYSRFKKIGPSCIITEVDENSYWM